MCVITSLVVVVFRLALAFDFGLAPNINLHIMLPLVLGTSVVVGLRSRLVALQVTRRSPLWRFATTHRGGGPPLPPHFSQAKAEFWGKATEGEVVQAASIVCTADLQKSYEIVAARQAGGKVPHLGPI